MNNGSFSHDELERALSLLESRIRILDNKPLDIVVCGGSALIATNLVSRTTRDVDILALKNDKGLYDPDPLPAYLIEAAAVVAKTINLPEDWLNTGPADLFRMGLPEGFEKRLLRKSYGTHLSINFIGRIDQIHFKLYASVDRGGYHIDDLLQLHPTEEELIKAAMWSQTHDVSEAYTMLLKELLTELGYGIAAERI